MAVRFLRITEAQVDDMRVTLRVLRAADGSLTGRVSTLAFDSSGRVELMSTTVPDDPPIAVAIKLAMDLARFKQSDVDVLDPDGLWQDAWGEVR